MVFLLSKILTFLINPLVWVCCLFVIALLNKNAIKQKRITIAGLVVLFVFSNVFLINQVLLCYEAKYEPYQTYDVGIVLGGFTGVNNKNSKAEFTGSSDRLLQTISLYRRGVIKKILISGGNIEIIRPEHREANLVAAYLRELGIPDSSIIAEDLSRNTIENAANSFKVITKINPKAKILVITSASHIPRVKLIFPKYFSNPLAYYPTDYIGKSGYKWSDFIIPSGHALINWNIILKEWVGLVVDRFRAQSQ